MTASPLPARSWCVSCHSLLCRVSDVRYCACLLRVAWVRLHSPRLRGDSIPSFFASRGGLATRATDERTRKCPIVIRFARLAQWVRFAIKKKSNEKSSSRDVKWLYVRWLRKLPNQKKGVLLLNAALKKRYNLLWDKQLREYSTAACLVRRGGRRERV